jgi:hypothetical protein
VRWLVLSCSIATALSCNKALISLLPATSSPVEASVDGGSESAGAPDAGVEPVPGLVSDWSFESGASDPVGGNDGTFLGGASVVTDPTRGRVLSCNGTDAGVRVSNDVGLSFSFSAWIWSNTPSDTGTSAAADGDTLVSANVPAIDDFAFAVLNDRLSYINYNQSSTGTTVVTDGQWHQVAFSREDGARVALYVDGKLDGDGNSGSGSVTANASVYFCGGEPAGRFFKGRIDDVRQYDRVLSPTEVRSLFVTAQ